VFDHVTIRVADREASERFYETVLRTLGIEKTHSDEELAEWDDFSLAQADDASPVTRRLHVGFSARSRADVDAFWSAGTESGYGGYVLDPDGNNVELVNHNRRGGGKVSGATKPRGRRARAACPAGRPRRAP
jgi:catechol 2,3-dioxygenase-like lactoylglutathione lyase family enzyme